MIYQKFKRFLTLNYFTLYYYQEIIVQYRIYYDRQKFGCLFESLEKYPLLNFRHTFPSNYVLCRGAGVDFPVKVPLPVHLRIIRSFFLFYVLRCFAVAFIPVVANTSQKRVLVGAELYKNDYFYLETTFLFWSSISLFYLSQLSTRVLDYKFLAIFSMSVPGGSTVNSLPSIAFGLSNNDFKKFKTFRKLVFIFNHLTIVTLSIFGPVCVSALYVAGSLYSNFPVPSFLWTLILDTWIYVVCTVIYSNLTAFTVVAVYLSFKQKSIKNSISGLIRNLNSNRHNNSNYSNSTLIFQLLFTLTRYSYLYDELADYNLFWAPFLSIVFVFYILLISLIIYIALFSTIAIYVKGAYAIIFNAHVNLLVAIIFLAGGIVRVNSRLVSTFTCAWNQYLQRHAFQNPKIIKLQSKASGRDFFGVSALTSLKMSHVTEILTSLNGRGFRLLNGYHITDDTARQIIVNIAVYFLLILKSQ